MAALNAPAHGAGPWLAVTASVLLAHGGLVAAVWGNPAEFTQSRAPTTLVQVALVANQEAPAVIKPPATTAAPASPRPQTVTMRPPEASPPLAPSAHWPTLVEAPPEQAPELSATAPLLPETDSVASEPEADQSTETSNGMSPAHPPSASLLDRPWRAPISGAWAYDVAGQAKGLNYRAIATMTWQQDGQRYDAQLELKALFVGSRTQHSQGRLGPDGLEPLRFTDKARKERVLEFDWAAGQLHSPGAAATALQAGAQDRLSLFLQLGRQMALLPSPPAIGHGWTVPVASPGEVEPWTFTYAGAESLVLPAGTLTAWKLERAPRHAHDQRVELWLAPELDFLPARIRLVQANGDSVDQQLSQRP